MRRAAIAGCGLSGAVIARELAESGAWQIDLFDERAHIGGNCHTERDSKTGIMVHQYGPHIFHTDDEEVWGYANRFAEFKPFYNRVKAIYRGQVYSLPISLHTINQFFKKSLSPDQAKDFIESISEQSIGTPKSFEEQALKFVGKDLYEAFFYGYTLKQWGVDPKQLPASILKRLPVRFNYNDTYYNCKYQGMPVNGYTDLIEKILDHPNIKYSLGQRVDDSLLSQYDHLFYSGTIDGFYGYRFGRLSYRSIEFERFYYDGDFQGNAVVNYSDMDVAHTRITEHKHFAPWESHEGSICFKEYSKQTGQNDIPYYPMSLKRDKSKLGHYLDLAAKEKNVTFVGRLGTYRYLDMHVCIREALNTGRAFLKKKI